MATSLPVRRLSQFTRIFSWLGRFTQSGAHMPAFDRVTNKDI